MTTTPNQFRAKVIVASNRASSGAYADTSGPVLVEGLRKLGAAVDDPLVVPDGRPVRDALRAALTDGVDLVVTSGGTGVSPTDRTPQVTAELLDYQVPGIAEAIRSYGAATVPTAALSRGVAGVAGGTLIVNLAGSSGAARDGLAVLESLIPHAIDQLRGGDHPLAAAGPGTAGPTAAGPTAAGHANPGDATAGRDIAAHAAAGHDHRHAGGEHDRETAGVPAGGGDHGVGQARPDARAVRTPAWPTARAVAHAAGSTGPEPIRLPLSDVDGCTLAEPLRTRTDLPAFATSSVDGYAVAGAGPWRRAGRVLAGQVPGPIQPGTAVEIATGAMVPAGTESVIRLEDSTPGADGTVDGAPREHPDWRRPGEEAAAGEELLPAGTPVTPGVVGIAAQCGHDTLLVRRPPRAAVLVFGDELLTAGPPGSGRVRDSLGPQLPSWLTRIGAVPRVPVGPPVADTLDAHVGAIRAAAGVADVVCTTGGTMRGPVDHLHPALTELGAEYLVDTVGVRPGFPMLLARLPGGKFLAGLPGNPQSAVIGLLTLVWPLVAGLTGRVLPDLSRARLGADVGGRGDHTHLALARIERDGLAYPLSHSGSAMLRGVARADGFAVVRPHGAAAVGDTVEFLPFPLRPGERP